MTTNYSLFTSTFGSTDWNGFWNSTCNILEEKPILHKQGKQPEVSCMWYRVFLHYKFLTLKKVKGIRRYLMSTQPCVMSVLEKSNFVFAFPLRQPALKTGRLITFTAFPQLQLNKLFSASSQVQEQNGVCGSKVCAAVVSNGILLNSICVPCISLRAHKLSVNNPPKYICVEIINPILRSPPLSSHYQKV